MLKRVISECCYLMQRDKRGNKKDCIYMFHMTSSRECLVLGQRISEGVLIMYTDDIQQTIFNKFSRLCLDMVRLYLST